MMFSEFVAGTGCRDNAHNREIFRGLETIYMNSDLTKEDIYKMAKGLVEVGKSAEQLIFEESIKDEIRTKERWIEEYKEEIERLEYYIGIETDESWIYEWKRTIKIRRDYIKNLRKEIKELKWVIA